MEIREYQSGDDHAINQIIAGLHPKWFDAAALQHIPFDLHFQKTWVAVEEGIVVGFISMYSQDGKPVIGWLGIDVTQHRKGIGKSLLDQVENEVVKFGGSSLRVETVVEQDPLDGSYDLTVKFYEACGFIVESQSEQKTSGEFTYRMGIMVKMLGK
jgi:ribosomal protein S18 acetylase RimI-like enzyme